MRWFKSKNSSFAGSFFYSTKKNNEFGMPASMVGSALINAVKVSAIPLPASMAMSAALNITRAVNMPMHASMAGSSLVTLSSFDPDYQAVLDYATTQGYTLPSTAQQALQNTFIVAVKDYWANFDCFNIMSTNGDSNFALVDYIRLITMSAVNSPTFTENQGYQGDGIAAYIDSLFNVSTAANYSLNNAAIWLYINNDSDSDRVFGVSNGSTTFTNFRPKSGAQMQANLNDGGASVFETSTNSSGLWCVQRVDSTTLEIYRNGVLFKSGADISVALLNLTLFLLAQSTNGGANSFTNYQIGFFAAGSQQDATAQAAIYTAWNNYLTAI